MLGNKLALRLAGGAANSRVRGQIWSGPATQLRAGSALLKAGVVFQRTYATPGRPKGAVGEPSKTVKRAVKRVAADKTAGVAVKAPKPKAAARKPAKKAAKKPVEIVELTEAQKEKEAAKTQRAAENLRKGEIAELKALALSPPKDLKSTRALNAWLVFTGEKNTERLANNGGKLKGLLPQFTRENVAAFRALLPAEREHYNHLANVKTVENRERYKAWVESFTPEQIRVANQARLKMRRLGAKAHIYPPIVDERLVKNRTFSYAFFLKERQLSGDLKGTGSVKDKAKLIAAEWQSLSESEKEKYRLLQEEDHERYDREFKSVYGHSHITKARKQEV